MDAGLVKLVATQGVWAVLFVSLLIYVLKQNEYRESRLQKSQDTLLAALTNLSDKYSELHGLYLELKKDIYEWLKKN